MDENLLEELKKSPKGIFFKGIEHTQRYLKKLIQQNMIRMMAIIFFYPLE